MKTWTWFAGSIVALLALLVSTVRADNLQALQHDAAELHGLVHALGQEVDAGLSHSPALPYIVAKVQQLENRAIQSERIFARPLSQQQLFGQLEILDSLTHTLQDAVADAGRPVFGHGPVCHVDPRRTQQVLAAIDAQIVHMQGHVAALQAWDFPQPVNYHNVGRPTYGNPGWNNAWNNWNQQQQVHPSWNQSSGNGISFNGRGISISLGR